MNTIFTSEETFPIIVCVFLFFVLFVFVCIPLRHQEKLFVADSKATISLNLMSLFFVYDFSFE